MTDRNTSSSDDAIEETRDFAPRFNADGLIPVVTTDQATGAVLMLAYMNAEALEKTIASGDAWYWSRSRQALWRKGETSGHTQKVQELRTDCDQDTLQLIVDQSGPACHTNRPSCFYRRITPANGGMLLELISDD
ncbi:phosphoribosyl-AMP cyclohydrolase [Hyphococcus sp.]|uniref:phosphoribosyl-AMP cyclohydrolase n=1 Tax=Hyphococcus sp. TaxID=2038636 RepID=UPI003CCBA507